MKGHSIIYFVLLLCVITFTGCSDTVSGAWITFKAFFWSDSKYYEIPDENLISEKLYKKYPHGGMVTEVTYRRGEKQHKRYYYKDRNERMIIIHNPTQSGEISEKGGNGYPYVRSIIWKIADDGLISFDFWGTFVVSFCTFICIGWVATRFLS